MQLVQQGETVLLLSGFFAGSEGTVESIDSATDTVMVAVQIFGNSVPLAFPLSDVEAHLTVFGDQPPVMACPDASMHQADLLSHCPDAEAAFRTPMAGRLTVIGMIQIFRIGTAHYLSTRSFDITTPLHDKTHYNTSEVPISADDWERFTHLVDECSFWQLPYDDGRRILRKDRPSRWCLEGYANGRYHCVERKTSAPTVEISACCEYLRELASPSE